MRTKKLCLLAVTIAVAVAAGAVVAWAAEGTLGLGPPWGTADQTDTNRVEVSYAVKASGKIPPEALAAVQNGIDDWNAAIDSREADDDNLWDFDLEPLADASSGSSSGGPPSAHHREGHKGGPDNGKGNGSSGGNGKGGGDADISIQLKKGGGVIAGSAQRTIDEEGFVVAVKIQISGSAFGLENDPETIREVTMHELGHALALGHHSNEDDLMGPTLGYEGGGPSACDLDGFEQAHEWLTADLGAKGAYVTDATSIECQAGPVDPETADLAIFKDGPETATVNEEFNYKLTATNNGPDGATGVRVVDTLPSEVTFQSVEPAGNCGETGDTVTCTFAELAPEQSETIAINVTPTAAGTITNKAEASAESPADPDEENNSAEAETVVKASGEGEPLEPGCEESWCPIQPGALLGDEELGFCTMGFLFRNEDSGRLLISTAAHCTEQEEEELHAEDEEESFRMQDEAFGTVVFRGDPDNAAQDFALIEIDEGREDEVSASVRHWAGPGGVAGTSDTSTGDQVMYYGYGIAFDLTPELRPRTGILTNHSEQEFQSNSAGMPGDSGASVLHESGRALGLISRFNVLEDGVSTDLGPTVEGMLSFLEDKGLDIELVDGAELSAPLLPL